MYAKLGSAAAAIVAAALMSISSANIASADDNTTPSGRSAQASSKNPVCDDCYAIMQSNGALFKGRDVRNTTKLGVGVYEIKFRYQFRWCSFQGTIGNPNFVGTQPPSFISITGRVGTNDAVFVETWDSAGVHADRAFHVVIVC
jgi:hypothetical protein